MGLEKGECKIAEGGDRSFWRQNEPRVPFLVSGGPSRGASELQVAMKVPTGSESSKFPVERTLPRVPAATVTASGLATGG